MLINVWDIHTNNFISFLENPSVSLNRRENYKKWDSPKTKRKISEVGCFEMKEYTKQFKHEAV